MHCCSNVRNLSNIRRNVCNICCFSTGLSALSMCKSSLRKPTKCERAFEFDIFLLWWFLQSLHHWSLVDSTTSCFTLYIWHINAIDALKKRLFKSVESCITSHSGNFMTHILNWWDRMHFPWSYSSLNMQNFPSLTLRSNDASSSVVDF